MLKRLPIRLILVTSMLFCCIQHSNAQTNEFQQFLDSLIYVFPKEKTDSAKGFIAMNIAQQKMRAAQNTGNWDEAIEWASKGVYYSKKGNYKLGIRRCNWQLGNCWRQKGNYPEAIRYFTELLKAAIKENTPKPIVTSCIWIGDCYMLLGDYQEALKNFQTGLKICEERSAEIFDYKSDQAGLILKIGDSYAKLNNFSLAIISYKKLLGDNQSDRTGDIHARLAMAQIGMKNYDEALKNLQIAVQRLPRLLNLKPDIEYRGILGSFLLQIGEAYCKLGSIQKVDVSLQSYKEAISYLNKCVPLLKEGAGGKETLMNAYALLKEACEATSDYQNALRFTTLYNSLKDSLYSKTTYLKLSELKTELKVKYELEKAAAEMKAQQKLERIEEDALRDKMLADQKLEQEKILADERVDNEKVTAEQKLEQEKAMVIAGEKANYEKSIAIEKISTEKQQTNNLLLMGLILVVITSLFLILYFQQRNQKKRAIEKAETIHQMAELEMQSIRSQLNPHFIFNSLNSIQTLILKEETDKSQSYLSQFARLLRMLLENADKPFIPLRKEIEFLQLYVGLEGLRVPDMQYSFSTDPALNTEQILIPNMFLQPYVENAIWHGLSHKETDKQLQIRIFSENGTVNYEIEDNGVGIKKAEELKSTFHKQHQSKGMELLSKRIKLLNSEYSSTIQTQITDVIKNNEVAGTLVTIKIPVRLFEPLQN